MPQFLILYGSKRSLVTTRKDYEKRNRWLDGWHNRGLSHSTESRDDVRGCLEEMFFRGRGSLLEDRRRHICHL